jgi:uncharacterized membrane protein YfcA
MSVLTFSVLIGLGSFLAGLLGSLTGLGGGVIMIPLLTLVFGVDIHYAMGASLVSVIATSSGSAAAYVREGYSNVRIGLFLEIATTSGALLGAMLATRAPTSLLATILGLVLLYTAFTRPRTEVPVKTETKTIRPRGFLRLDGNMPEATGPVPYRARRIPLAFGLMGVAGIMSGLLGIGSGAIKVLAMDWAMGLPFKVSTTTSNFMIGVTAAAGAGVYLRNGYIQPGLAMPVVLGVLAGSMIGAKILMSKPSPYLRTIFRFVIGALGMELIFNGLKGRL